MKESEETPMTATTATEEDKALQRRRRRRRRVCCACGTCLALILILAVVALILGLVVFRVRQPTTTLVSATPRGLATRFSLAPLRLELNLTVETELLVYNPNRASFTFADGDTTLTYRGTVVGEGVVLPGHVPARGSARLITRVTVDGGEFLENPAVVIEELTAGQLSLSSSTVVPGRVTILGFIRRHVVTYTDCDFVFGISILSPPSIVQQKCRQRTSV